jgi:two-component system LytT family response regulator
MVKDFTYCIVDDEPPSINVARTLMDRQTNFTLMASWTDPQKALKEIHQINPDLLFLDVQMPTMTGLDLLRQVEIKPITIITTAYPEYAIDAFSLGVREYILKPMSEQRLELALSNVTQLLQAKKTSEKAGRALFFKDGYGQRFIEPSEIVRIEAYGSFSKFILTDPPSCLISESLRELSERLNIFGFVRIHKSTLININHIKAITSDTVTLSDNVASTIGRAYKQDFRDICKL